MHKKLKENICPRKIFISFENEGNTNYFLIKLFYDHSKISFCIPTMHYTKKTVHIYIIYIQYHKTENDC